ncbi:MAG TPA: hemerythrin domain-containing protein [Streptosporangiaceae bacterium]|nr:hemerythrin domain-containing protein [Streptosporangiaceae bacterium]
MTTQNHPEIHPEINPEIHPELRPDIGRNYARRARPAPGPVDFTVMYAAHDAFHRDLVRLTEAVRSGRTGDPAVRAGWTTFKNQLHLHHTAEDIALWPALRRQVTDPAEIAVLDAMEAEHARIDPLLAQVDAALAGAGDSRAGDSRATLSGSVAALADTLTRHMAHEEDEALPLVAAHLGGAGWAAFGKQAGRSQGLRGAAEFFAWMLDGASADTTRRLLGLLPPPARLLYRAVWRPAYARRPRWTDGPS